MIQYPDLKTLTILQYPDPRLREEAQDLKELDSFLDELTDRMNELMVEARGAGLASTQVGWPYRFILINTTGEPDGLQAYVNPVILAKRGKAVQDEGCLSVPGVWAKVKRAEWVKVRAQLPSGETVEMEAEGLEARAWQHELDHLQGGLFVDRIGPASKILVAGRLRELRHVYEEVKSGADPES